jgi:RND family efflux transporter MFP subunit
MRSTIPLFIAAALLSGCGKSDHQAPATGASAPASAPSLLLAPEDLLTLRPNSLSSGPVITGAIQPERRADLRGEVAAVVLQVLKDNGEPVRSGDLLVRLDDTAIRDSLSSAEAALRAAVQTQDQAERQVQRQKTLLAQGMTSTQALEDAEMRRNSAASEGVAAKAQVATARQQLQRTLVRAPFDGVVSERKASAGDTVQIGKELLKVIDPRSMRFEGLVTADRLGELKIGQPVSFKVNGFAQGEFAGVVRRIDAAANATTRQVAVIVDFRDAAKAPRVAGLFAEGRIESGAVQALTLPENALQRAGESAQVWRLNGSSLARVGVKLGERDPRSGEFPVLQGLAAGDRVLRNPGAALVDGQQFEYAKPAAAASAPASASR